MAFLRKRGRVWYIRFTDASGQKRETKGSTDREVAEELGRELEADAVRIRKGLVTRRDLAARGHEARSIAAHLADFHRNILDRGKTVKHAAQFLDRASKLAAVATGTPLANLERGRKSESLERSAAALAGALESAVVPDLTPDAIQGALARLREAGKSHQTCNHYRSAMRAFLRWMQDVGRLRETPFQGVTGYDPGEDPRHVRRSLTDAELARVIKAAEQGPELWTMIGALRAMAYRLAAATGFRAAELRSLTPGSFRLDGPAPIVYLKTSATKNGKPATQPLPAAIVPDLRRWLENVPEGESAFPLHRETAKAIRTDMGTAGVPYETEEGIADFHSLRAYYVTALIRSGASIKTVQDLARHAKAETTLKHYAKVSAQDMRAAVEALPCLGDGPTHAEPDLARHLPAGIGSKGRKRARRGASGKPGRLLIRKPQVLFSPAYRRIARRKSGEGGIRTPEGL